MNDGRPRFEAFGFDFDHTLGFDHHLEQTVALDMLDGANERDVVVALAAFRYGARSLDDAIGSLGLDPARFRSIVVERAPKFIEPAEGASELLRELAQQRIPSAILSNGWSPLQEEKARLIGFSGPVLVSERIGARKPTLGAFLRLEHTLGIAAARIAYVGDDPVPDMCGALSAGMQAIWLDAEGRSYPQDIADPKERIRSLLDLLRLVQGPPQETAKPPA